MCCTMYHVNYCAIVPLGLDRRFQFLRMYVVCTEQYKLRLGRRYCSLVYQGQITVFAVRTRRCSRMNHLCCKFVKFITESYKILINIFLQFLLRSMTQAKLFQKGYIMSKLVANQLSYVFRSKCKKSYSTPVIFIHAFLRTNFTQG